MRPAKRRRMHVLCTGSARRAANPETTMTKTSADKLARMHRAAGRTVRVVKHRGVDWRNRNAVFYTVEVA